MPVMLPPPALAELSPEARAATERLEVFWLHELPPDLSQLYREALAFRAGRGEPPPHWGGLIAHVRHTYTNWEAATCFYDRVPVSARPEIKDVLRERFFIAVAEMLRYVYGRDAEAQVAELQRRST